jgi:acyl dehydratase/putative sterol carrier protein
MPLNMNAVGRPIGPIESEYTWKDVVLYALGVGAGFKELDYCYEKELKIIPSFAIARIFDFFFKAAAASGVNLMGILHGEQELIFHSPIPAEGKMTTTGKVTGIFDKGRDKGALVVAESETVHGNGRKLYTSIITIFGRLDGGFGGRDLKKPPVIFPDREPDFTIESSPSPDQPLLYRLSGDIFQLHVDPAFARMAGFEKPIMHGLCTHGFACRALIAALIPGQPEKARRMACRFSKPLYPGVPICTRIWKTGGSRAVWRTVNTKTGDIVIDSGEFEYGEVPAVETHPDAATDPRTPPTPTFDSAAAVFAAMPKAFVAEEAAGVNVVFQYIIDGPDGGKWHCIVKDEVCKVVAGSHESPTCILIIKDSDFLRMMNGQLPPMQAFTTGKLTVEGDVMQALLIEKMFPVQGSR